MHPLVLVALVAFLFVALGAGSAALALLDAMKQGRALAMRCAFVPGYLFFYLARRSTSRWRWALLVGITLGALAALCIVGFVVLAESCPVKEPYPLAI
jgi:hypothetical protein